MSVLVPELEVFNAVYGRLRTYPSRKTVDINYCSVFSNSTEKEIKDFVIQLYELNVLTYVVAHGGDEADPKFLKWAWNGKNESVVQILKYLHCIQYNIDLEEIMLARSLSSRQIGKYQQTLKTLSRLVASISQAIIEECTDYNDCRWQDVTLKTAEPC